MGKLQIIVGGQFGSEGKGAIAGYLASKEKDLLAIRTAGPNAGHTVYDKEGNKFPLRQIPVAAVTNPTAGLAISAGSEVDMKVLAGEVEDIESYGHAVADRLFVDGQATVLEMRHLLREQDTGIVNRIGSTGKGIGAARADRIMRTARTVSGVGAKHYNVRDLAIDHLTNGGCVQIEAAQGFGLGLHAGYYPFCTSGDCTAVDACALVGLSPWASYVGELEVWIVVRTYPIRVAGNSGPLRHEITWAELNRATSGYVKPEYTTVTHKERRVGQWDHELVADAIQANGGPGRVRIALTMMDYWFPKYANQGGNLEETPGSLLDNVRALSEDLGVSIQLVGTGPRTLYDLRQVKIGA